MTVNVGKVPEKPRPLSHQDMRNFKVKYGVSNQDTQLQDTSWVRQRRVILGGLPGATDGHRGRFSGDNHHQN